MRLSRLDNPSLVSPDEIQTKELIVTSELSGMRIDAYLAAAGAYSTRSAAARAIENYEVTVNGVPVRKSSVVSEHDLISYIPCIECAQDLYASDIPLSVIYEDDYLLVISKQAGLVCHPADGHTGETLVHALLAHCGREHLCDVQGEQDRLGIVHRLDRDTTGLMLCAKTNDVGLALMEAIRTRDVERHYLALVHGWIPLDTGLVDAPIARHHKQRLRMEVSDRENARSSITTFKVLERFLPGKRDDGYSLIDCKLHTGRTHQIRVHMEYIKHPCVGDPMYGWQKKDNLGLDRQFLHSYKLSFTHPVTGEFMEFVDELPLDLQSALDTLRMREDI